MTSLGNGLTVKCAGDEGYPETRARGMCAPREVFYGDLAPVITEAEKSLDLYLASWDPRRAHVSVFSLNPKAGKD